MRCSSWGSLQTAALTLLVPPLHQVTRPLPRASQQAGMADGRQPDEHWSTNGQENAENGYSAYSSAYSQNGYHGGAAAHPGTTGRRTRACGVIVQWHWPDCQMGKCDWCHGARRGQTIPLNMKSLCYESLVDLTAQVIKKYKGYGEILTEQQKASLL